MMGVRWTGSSSSVRPPTGCTQGPNHTFSSEDKEKEIPSGRTKEDVYYDVLFVLHLWKIHSQICFRGLARGKMILLRGPGECMLRKVCDWSLFKDLLPNIGHCYVAPISSVGRADITCSDALSCCSGLSPGLGPFVACFSLIPSHFISEAVLSIEVKRHSNELPTQQMLCSSVVVRGLLLDFHWKWTQPKTLNKCFCFIQ